MLEAAITTIMDCEDSVAAVDAEDKVDAYRNWLGLMSGDLSEDVPRAADHHSRAQSRSRIHRRGRRGQLKVPLADAGAQCRSPDDQPGNSYPDGSEMPEGMLDAMVTVLIAMHDIANGRARIRHRLDLHRQAKDARARGSCLCRRNIHPRRSGAGLAPNTVKIGIMDEERRTTVNLKECIRAAKDRVAFINTGFLDRTGDEMHTSMQAGPMVRKADMKAPTGSMPTNSGTSISVWHAAWPAMRRSARACGPCRI